MTNQKLINCWFGCSSEKSGFILINYSFMLRLLKPILWLFFLSKNYLDGYWMVYNYSIFLVLIKQLLFVLLYFFKQRFRMTFLWNISHKFSCFLNLIGVPRGGNQQDISDNLEFFCASFQWKLNHRERNLLSFVYLLSLNKSLLKLKSLKGFTSKNINMNDKYTVWFAWKNVQVYFGVHHFKAGIQRF